MMSKRGAPPGSRGRHGGTPRRTSRRRRALGQHFLASHTAIAKIIDAFDPVAGETVVEIGPGRGALTAPLLESGARVVAVELDEALAQSLSCRYGAHPRFTLVHADILRCDLAGLCGGEPARVLANLPYSITGEVLIRLFAAADRFTSLMLMLQREVVDRIVAAPGGRVYGSLSVLAQYFTEPRIVLTLPPGAFDPPPAVTSAVVSMPVRRSRELAGAAETSYPVFIRSLFAHRRRTLLNNLRAAGVAPGGDATALAGLLERTGIDPVRRPETLAREEFLRLWRALHG